MTALFNVGVGLIMPLYQIVILAIVQGAAELLPVSSSAHVIVAEKLMGLDPTKPEMTLLLVMLHTGTMFAVIYYFWKSWRESFFSSSKVLLDSVKMVILATGITGIVGLSLKHLIEKFFMANVSHAEIEMLFGNLNLISVSLAVVGVLIIFAGIKGRNIPDEKSSVGILESSCIGAVQGVCLPFRGFSRSGATISTGLLLKTSRRKAEEFSFALAVVLTPPVIVREVMRLMKGQHASTIRDMTGLFMPSLLGMVFSFIAGLIALKWLSSWLEKGRWHLFGVYCICASIVVFILHLNGL